MTHRDSATTEAINTAEELVSVESELIQVQAEIETLIRRRDFLVKRKEGLKDRALLEKSRLLASHNWSRTDHKWSNDVDNILQSVFNLNGFREHQLPTINAVLSEKDVILLMPTGGGKSLCYQLPALYLKGLTLVVSPLISLMEDQVMALNALNINAKILSSTSRKEEVNSIQQEMVSENSKLKLLYVTPEKLAKSKRFMSKLQKCYQLRHLSLIAIDEVHCCSQWGHDFRPDYKYLGVLKPMFPDVPVLGVTATATAHVLTDVQKMLSIQGCLVIKAHFNRPNLYYEVREKSSVHKDCVEQLDTLLKKRFAGQSGIIYTTTIKDCEDLSKDLRMLGNAVGCYHAQMEASSRSHAHNKWLSGGYQAVIATIAFGLGIDKPNVRFVIHHSLSKSMENYYQESGRAGRDNQPADCILFYRLADIFKISTMVYATQGALEKLYNMVAYCIDKTRCRRDMIASQFEEPWESKDCNKMCDHCRQPREGKEMNITEYCLGLFDILTKGANMDRRLTAQMIIDAWLNKGPIELRLPNITRPPPQLAETVMAFLLVESYLQEDFQISPYKANTYIRRGARASCVMSKKHQITMSVGGPRKLEPSTGTTPSTSTSTSASFENKLAKKVTSKSGSTKKKSLSLSLASHGKEEVSSVNTSLQNAKKVKQKSDTKPSKKVQEISKSAVSEKTDTCLLKLTSSMSADDGMQSEGEKTNVEVMFVSSDEESKPTNLAQFRKKRIVTISSDDDFSSDEDRQMKKKRKTNDINGKVKSCKRIQVID